MTTRRSFLTGAAAIGVAAVATEELLAVAAPSWMDRLPMNTYRWRYAGDGIEQPSGICWRLLPVNGLPLGTNVSGGETRLGDIYLEYA